ncbi:MAG: ABC transporter permease [Negativicutes bacterium]|nr:ABC transporter permease [Negativicutes bacterium]
MKLNKNDFTGIGKVYSFTLTQYAKSKANLIALAIMLLLVLVSVPLVVLFKGNPTEGIPTTNLSKVYLLNETGFALQLEKAAQHNPQLADVTFLEVESVPENAAGQLTAEELFLHLYPANHTYAIDVFSSSASALSNAEISQLTSLISYLFSQARLSGLGVTAEQFGVVMSGYSSSISSIEEYLHPRQSLGMDAKFLIQYIYAILVMILCLTSSIYIIRTIIEEKSSKLVELLMISIKPLAMIAGKILAVMTYVFGMILGLGAAFLLSYWLTGYFADVSIITTMLTGLGFSSALLNIGWFTIVIVLVSLLLGYLTFSLIAGIAGTSCSSMEDVNSASQLTTMIVMAGYLISLFAVNFENSAVSIITSLSPIVAVFCAPVAFVSGNISFTILLLSWFLQALTVAFLAWFCARIYQDLLLHKGSRVEFKEMLVMAKNNKVSVKVGK